MKQWLFIIMLLSFVATSSTMFAMDRAKKRNKNMGNVLAVAYLQKKVVALGTMHGCYLVSNPASPQPTVEQLHDQATHNLITDKKKQKLGLLCQDKFFAYDTETKKVIWHCLIHNDDGYSAAFSATDDTIFVCNKGELFSNKRSFSIALPFTGANSYFGIACHPRQQHILYPMNESTIALIEHGGRHVATHKPTIGAKDAIVSIICNPDESHIAILTKLQNLYIYNLTTKSTHQIKHDFCNSRCHYAVFLPDSAVIATLCDKAAVHFCNFKTNKYIGFTKEYSRSSLSKKSIVTNSMLTWSTDMDHFAVLIKNKYKVRPTPPEIARLILTHAYFAISCLIEYSKQHPIPTEIINLIARLLFAFY